MTHVVAISGGKDSTAMALALREREPREYTYVCTPTGDELPQMQSHWDRLESLLDTEIQRLPEMSLAELIESEQMLPNWRARFCTHRLKILPFEQYLLAHLPAVAYVGLRADEPGRGGAEYACELYVTTRWPLREWGWGLSDVQDYLADRGVTVPARTDCARCPLQTLAEWHTLWQEHPDLYESACQDEDRIGHTYRSPGRDTWPAGLRELGKRFAAGDTPAPRRRSGGCRVCSL